MKICLIEGCNGKHYAKGYCQKHYRQMKNLGTIIRTKDEPNEIVEYEDYAEIILYNRQKEEIARAIIDLEDIEICKDIKWSTDINRYVFNTKVGRLHRYLLGITDDDIAIDHINRNPLDNRRDNLRICTKQQNYCNRKSPKDNSTGYRGISKKGNKYQAMITYKCKKIYIGLFDTAEEAHIAYLNKAKELHGEYNYELTNEDLNEKE